jgi:tRNA 5-methylaminomethyl-2-thiouridine biosynthesis bifunctional protein
MLEGAKFIKESVDRLIYDDGLWIINDTYAAKEVILATGAYKNVVAEPYINLRGVWGHRIDIKTTTHNPHSIHQFVSISPSKDGMLAIGATHNVHYHPQKNKEPYDIQSGREELLQKAAKTIKLENIEVVKDYMGLRSGSFDYMPLVGELVMSEETLKSSSQNLKVKKADFSQFVYYPNLYMINGSGGYGFVLAPYLAKILKEHIMSAKEISERISPARFFARWAKKL